MPGSCGLHKTVALGVLREHAQPEPQASQLLCGSHPKQQLSVLAIPMMMQDEDKAGEGAAMDTDAEPVVGPMPVAEGEGEEAMQE